MILEIDEKEIAKHWEEGRIQCFMKELGLTRLETILYLWAFNYIFICQNDLKDLGRPMYVKFAQGFSRLIKEKGDQ